MTIFHKWTYFSSFQAGIYVSTSNLEAGIANQVNKI